MPNYRPFQLVTPLEQLERAVAEARRVGTFDAHAAPLRDKAIALLERECGQAESVSRENLKHVEGLRGQAQALLAAMTRQAAPRTLDPKSLEQLAQALDRLRALHADARADNLRMRDALGSDYRGDAWVDSARAILGDHVVLQRSLASRKRSFEVNKAAVSLMERCGEYVERAEELLHQAVLRNRPKPAGQSPADGLKELAREAQVMSDRILKTAAEVTELFDRQRGTLDDLEKLVAKGIAGMLPKTLEMHRARLMTLRAGFKNGRGRLKTLAQLLAAFDDWIRHKDLQGNGLAESWSKAARQAVAKVSERVQTDGKREEALAKAYR